MGVPVFSQKDPTVAWKDALKQKTDWYSSAEASRIADNLLLYQRDSGGWPKNIDMAASLSEVEKTRLSAEKKEIDSTIDNNSTYSQLIFLARVVTVKPAESYRDAFFKGLDYLLKAQYENGGWPQFYPDLSGYYKHITYNDDAMIGVMKLLRDVARKKPDYAFIDDERRTKSERAVQKGIGCILRTQVIVDGKLTVWCAQHDEVTLAPAAARKFEPVSLSGGESVGIVRFLMSIDKPGPEVVAAIKAAIAWFEKSKLTGIKWIAKPDASKMHGFDRVVVKDPSAGSLWARFYDVKTNRPIFVGRDSIVKYDVAEIEDERRNGYAWYVDGAAELLSKEYPKWLKEHP
ncbi:MAG TPA: pectate lyase [Pyrinomonadaceae bacterium]|jgi:PelA/Pel-15E family pectate lyase|nr:pectate lyase [Pyrinomonadaceae bacterium]